jgi:hypothetical protein
MQTPDLDELKQLVAELRADHVAQKQKEKRESWTKFVSLTMVCIAVLAAIATLKGGGFSTRTLKEMNEATFNQAQASDQWSFYEARSIKENLYEIELEHLEAAPAPDAVAIGKIKDKINKYEKDKRTSPRSQKNSRSPAMPPAKPRQARRNIPNRWVCRSRCFRSPWRWARCV